MTDSKLQNDGTNNAQILETEEKKVDLDIWPRPQAQDSIFYTVAGVDIFLDFRLEDTSKNPKHQGYRHPIRLISKTPSQWKRN